LTPFSPLYLSYRSTNSFSAIATDYVEGNSQLKPLYAFSADLAGVQSAIDQRKKFPTNRKLLVEHLQQQYKNIPLSETLRANIESLSEENTFTITTAHQPNIFTGHLYFIYKIIHAIKLASTLQEQQPDYKFVPVYYMGSEDADLEELGEVFINGKTYRWQTGQTGAVGRMKVDKKFMELMDAIEAQLGVAPFGNDILLKMRAAYQLDKTIEQATFELVHDLFGAKGLIVLLPDSAALKASFAPVMERELAESFSHAAVEQTMKEFPPAYNIQAAGREINLFYLQPAARDRIERSGDGFVAGDIKFSKEEILQQLKENPERFSPNVILRPVFQEWILPNIVFIGGGGELAYWLELKKVFEATGTPFPVMVLRNSFLLLTKGVQEKMDALGLDEKAMFKPVDQLLKGIIEKHSKIQLTLDAEKLALAELYKTISAVAGKADTTLTNHVAALQVAAEKRLNQLEKKIYKAEKKRFEAQQRQLEKIYNLLYPTGNLQERVENLLPWYAIYGPVFLESLFEHSLSMEQQFCILREN
jgi:bacillithiol biosynthesis cysteine-adding enzyme BshC